MARTKKMTLINTPRELQIEFVSATEQLKRYKKMLKFKKDRDFVSQIEKDLLKLDYKLQQLRERAKGREKGKDNSIYKDSMIGLYNVTKANRKKR